MGLAPACSDVFGSGSSAAEGASSGLGVGRAGAGSAGAFGSGGNGATTSQSTGGSTDQNGGRNESQDDAGATTDESDASALGPSVDAGPPNCPLPVATPIPALKLTLVAGGLEQPVFMTQAPGEGSRSFILEKPGRVRVMVDGTLLEEPFLDITDRVDDDVEEMGLLGLAFHPRYADNGLFYVMYSSDSQGGYNPPHTAYLAEYAVDPKQPDRALDDERRVLAVAEPQGNHNGGNLAFGPDGLLYIGLGDGGGGGDDHGELGNGQALDTLLGKLLRIDVDGRGAGTLAAYAIPPGNFREQNAAALPEIWSFGLRNPWRFSFDSCSGDLYIGDVGQESREEIDYQPAHAAAGRNYGWRLMEAGQCYEPDDGCDAAVQGLVLPLASYDRDTGQAITGGYVYWGNAIPELRGTYVYADYLSAAFFALRVNHGELEAAPSDISDNLNPARAVRNISSLGRDNAGELYVVSFAGELFRIDRE